jgi:uncharacterized protein YjbJ (UPF0337 family)
VSRKFTGCCRLLKKDLTARASKPLVPERVQGRSNEPFSAACQEIKMNWDQLKGNWKQAKGKIKEQWGQLTDDEIDEIEGRRDQLIGKIQKQYGISKEEAERQVNDWGNRL